MTNLQTSQPTPDPATPNKALDSVLRTHLAEILYGLENLRGWWPDGKLAARDAPRARRRRADRSLAGGRERGGCVSDHAEMRARAEAVLQSTGFAGHNPTGEEVADAYNHVWRTRDALARDVIALTEQAADSLAETFAEKARESAMRAARCRRDGVYELAEMCDAETGAWREAETLARLSTGQPTKGSATNLRQPEPQAKDAADGKAGQ